MLIYFLPVIVVLCWSFAFIINLITTIMSNACKNSLLVIAAVIICVATSLFGSNVFAQSELYFPVNSNVSYVAPDLQTVFVGYEYEYETVVVTRSTELEIAIKTVETEVQNLQVAMESIVVTTDMDADETPQATSTDFVVTTTTTEEVPVGYSELYFPIHSMNKVSYAAPSMDEVFFTNQEYGTVVTGRYEELNEAEMQAFIAKEIAVIERQVAVLQQQIVALTKESADVFGCGSCGPHVENLQKFLNRNGFALAAIGSGSMGQETKFFGPLTLKALQKFQSAYGIPASGRVDTSTKILIESIEYNALGEITAESCVTQRTVQKSAEEKNDENSQSDDEVSGNFFTNLIQKIFEFFRNLFQRDYSA